jgi:general stress protein 26
MNELIRHKIFNLIENSRDVIVCSIDENGFPNAKAMFKISDESINTFWFSTNTSSIRTQQWLKQPKACIYFVDAKDVHGLMFTGNMQVCMDNETKQKHWHEGDEVYYPLGVTDPDYCILKFEAHKGNYYHGLQKHIFNVNEIYK